MALGPYHLIITRVSSWKFSTEDLDSIPKPSKIKLTKRSSFVAASLMFYELTNWLAGEPISHQKQAQTFDPKLMRSLVRVYILGLVLWLWL